LNAFCKKFHTSDSLIWRGFLQKHSLKKIY
jgi:hypothetical protein